MEILCCPCCGQLGQVLLTQQEYADRFGKPPELALPSGQVAPQHIPAAQPQRQHAGGQPRGGADGGSKARCREATPGRRRGCERSPLPGVPHQ